AGRSDREALDRSLSTSGLAVTFSGLAVIISLAGLWMVDNQALRSMALGAMTVVAVSILSATTLLPALIPFLADPPMPAAVSANRPSPGRPARGSPAQTLQGPPAAPGRGSEGQSISVSSGPSEGRGGGGLFWLKWTRNVMAHPWVAVVGVTSVLLLLAVPLLS